MVGKKLYSQNMCNITLITFLLVAMTVASLPMTPAISSVAELVKSTCAATLYPELCISTATAAPAAIESGKDVLMATLDYTVYTVEQNYFAVKRIAGRGHYLTGRRQARALDDCVEMIVYTLDELREAAEELKDYGISGDIYSLIDCKDDVMTYLSAVQANQKSCLDGFSEDDYEHDDADEQVHRDLLASQMHVFRLVSNLLAIIKNLTDTEMANNNMRWRLGDGHDWPEWLSAGDRRMLQAAMVTPNITVAADGSGNYITISEAVEAAPRRSNERYVIRIKGGVYNENVVVPSSKTNLMFVGDGENATIITGNRSVGTNYTTFNSATVAVSGRGFLARDITFENTAGPSNHQAVALRVSADHTALYRCTMSAYQDTLYTHSLRQFYTRCTIIGTIDFIFGRGTALLQDCDIRARANETQNVVTADGRADPNQNTGIVIQRSTIAATDDLQPVQGDYSTYLGRPWGEYSRTVVMQSEITDVIRPEGWRRWNDSDYGLDTCFYAEYENTGAGAGTANRVTWMGFRVLSSDKEAEPFTAGEFIAGEEWLPETGFPFCLGL